MLNYRANKEKLIKPIIYARATFREPSIIGTEDTSNFALTIDLDVTFAMFLK
jgi:hypothetical protein